MPNAPVYIPQGTPAVKVLPGSALVGGQTLKNDRVVVYFEGNKHQIPDLRRFVARVGLAYGRMNQKAPTVAKAAFEPADLLQVGEYDPVRLAVSVHGTENLVQLGAWIGKLVEHDTLPVEELIYRNPRQIKDFEEFVQLVQAGGQFHLHHATEGDCLKRDFTITWDGKQYVLQGSSRKTLRFDTKAFEVGQPMNFIPMALKQHTLYYVIDGVKWGVGW